MAAGVSAKPTASNARAWRHLVTLSLRRQLWSPQTLIAVLLIALVATFVLLQSVWLWRRDGVWGWEFVRFTRAMIGNIYIGFMLPILCLAFGTYALGGEWEERSLVWLLTRPLPRPLIYAAKFVAALPWAFGLTLGGLFLFGGFAGREALRAVYYFWPAVAWGTLAYLSLFVLMGAWFRRSTVLAVVYSFVVETIVGNMPGLVKRCSIGFYARCLLYDIAGQHGFDTVGDKRGIAPDKRELFMPVDGTTAIYVLALVSLAFFVLGIIVFSRREYQDLT